MKCTNCEAEIEDNCNYCSNCGKQNTQGFNIKYNVPNVNQASTTEYNQYSDLQNLYTNNVYTEYDPTASRKGISCLVFLGVFIILVLAIAS